MLTNPHLRAWADPYLRRVGLYSAYQLSREEYIGKAGRHIRDWLEREYDTPRTVAGVPLEAAKYHWQTGQVHDFSVRKVDRAAPRHQWHIHGFDIADNGIYSLASHYELRPDLRVLDGEDIGDAVARLRTHYSPQWGADYLRGEAPAGLLAKV